MHISRLFGQTLREAPADADTISHQLLVRAGMIHQIAAGLYSYLPLGWRVLRKIEQIIREEMDAVDGQELHLPALQPFEIWEETGRDLTFGQTLFTVKDRRDRKLCLGPTHEEVITKLARFSIRSYRDLPAMPYQIQTKFRDEPRSRGGLLRVREFLMKDAYSIHADMDDLDRTYERLIHAYRNIYDRCGLSSLMVEADSGAIGGKDSHEFMIITDTGEDEIIYCSKCDYAANSERASFAKNTSDTQEELRPLEEVATPGKKTIEEVADFLNVPKHKTLKAIFYSADGEVIFATIRGDLEVNELKLKNALKCVNLKLATDEEVKSAGLIAGSASAIGLSGIKVIADDSITLGSNFVVGANKPDAHFKNANYPRDFNVDEMIDIALAQAGYKCPRCGSELLSTRGIEVGHLFKLGTIFSEKLGATFLDPDGNQKPIVMGCYGIGLGRLLAAAVEQNHDEKGIVWPHSIAPYDVYLCALSTKDEQVSQTADKLYADLSSAGFDVLLDDRDESAGIKFNDADLIGIPVRIVISPRNLKKGSIEIKKRNEKEAVLAPLENVREKLKDLLS